jgi:hypothetical protein
MSEAHFSKKKIVKVRHTIHLKMTIIVKKFSTHPCNHACMQHKKQRNTNTTKNEHHGRKKKILKMHTHAENDTTINFISHQNRKYPTYQTFCFSFAEKGFEHGLSTQ